MKRSSFSRLATTAEGAVATGGGGPFEKRTPGCHSGRRSLRRTGCHRRKRIRLARSGLLKLAVIKEDGDVCLVPADEVHLVT